MLSILKLVSCETLAGNDFSDGGTSAHCEETSVANCEVLDQKYHIAVQGIFCRHYYKLVALVLR